MNVETDSVLEPREAPPVSGALWFALFSGMAAFAIDEMLSYALTFHACSTGRYWLVHVVTAATIAVALFGIFLGFAEWRGVGAKSSGRNSRYDNRTRFLAISAMAMDIGFLILIVATAVPKAMLSPCQ